jgi:hypothetical protein
MNTVPVKLVTALLLFALASYAVPANAKSAIAEAAAAKQYLGLLFYDTQDASLTAMSSAIAAFNKSATKKISAFKAVVSDPANKEIADKYGIQSGSDLPIVLIIAPNGAITGGFPKAVTADQLKQCTGVSDLMLKTLKPLQEYKVALVALQNATTKFSTESWAGVNDFVNDTLYKKFVTAIKADPAAAGSQEFVKQCQLMTPLTEATVVILMPPGKIGKVLTGKLTKADVLKALGSCATGCAPGACSDRRFKENIKPIASALEKVTKLQGVTFTWNANDYPGKFFTEDPQVGLIAQDVEAVLPEAVLTDNDGFKSVTYDKLTAVLIEAVKEMKIQMNAQDSIINAQGAQIKALSASARLQ